MYVDLWAMMVLCLRKSELAFVLSFFSMRVWLDRAYWAVLSTVMAL